MDENLHYLLHEELEGLFDLPAGGAAHPPSPRAAPATGATAGTAATGAPPAATPAPGSQAPPAATTSEPAIADLIGRLADPKVLQALAHLLGVR